MAKPKVSLPRKPPKRTITKRQAIRHLIHCAGRMLAAREDPFAIHLLIQSADKLLIDIAKKEKRSQVFTWDEMLKPEYRKERPSLHWRAATCEDQMRLKFHRFTYRRWNVLAPYQEVSEPGLGRTLSDDLASVARPGIFYLSGTKDQRCEFWLRLLPQSYTWRLRPRSKAGAVFL
jgi:hypothetical protein